MFNKKYYLIYPTVGDVSTANKLWFQEDMIVFEAVDFMTGLYVNTQYLPKTQLNKIIQYPDWNTFKAAVDRLLVQVKLEKEAIKNDPK